MRTKKLLCWVIMITMLLGTIPVTAAESSTQENHISVAAGSEVQLETAVPEEIRYVYASGNSAVAEVNTDGEISALSKGSCDITAFAYYGETLVGTKTTNVTVTAEEEEVNPEETPDPPVPEETPDPEPSGFTTFVFDGSKVTVIEGTDTEYAIVNKSGDAVAESGKDEEGNAYYIAEEDDVAAVEIGKKGGSYVFEGTASDSSISVKKEATADAVLYLNGLEMTSSYTAPVLIKKDSSAKVSIVVVEGTVNKLEDHAYNNDDNYPDNGDAENAVIKAKSGSDVTICGEGKLIINGNAKNGIKAATKLTIEEVELYVTCLNNGIASDTEMLINSGTYVIECGNDGIKSENDEGPVGSITINDGDFTIDSVGDCIVATNTLTINGGTFDLTAYDGYDAVYDGDDDSYPSAKGIKASGSYIVEDEETGEETEIDFVKDNQLNIHGGSFVINTADDGVHSDGNVTITGGVFEIWTGDDGVHSDYWTILGEEGKEGPLITILSCVEGIEGASVVIYHGDYKIYCSDDIINAANADLTGWDYEICIYDGTFFGSTYMGDGYDSNGNMKLYGGTHVIQSDTGLGENNEAIDCDGSVTLAGATLLTIGKSGMGVSYSSASTNAYVTFGGNGGMGGMQPGRPGQTTQSSVSVAAGDVVQVKDSAGNILIEATAYWDEINNGRNASYVMYSSPELAASDSCVLFVNGTQAAQGTAQAISGGRSFGMLRNTEEPALILNVTQAEKPEIHVTYAYKTSDPDIAQVTEAGLIKGVKRGNAAVSETILVNGIEAAVTNYSVRVYRILPFTDVEEDDWFFDAVEYVYDHGFMSGYNHEFHPQMDTTRAQFVTTLYRLAGNPENDDKSACEYFTDVEEGQYYTDAICWAYAEGVATGDPETLKFNTTATLTRQQMAAFLYRFSDYMGYDTTVRGDYSSMLNGDQVSEYAVEAVEWAVGAGLLSGSLAGFDDAGNEIRDLNPRGNTTRAQLAIILMRYHESMMK